MSHQNPDYVLILEDQATNSSYTLHVSRDVYNKATKDLSFATKLLESRKASIAEQAIAEQASNAVQTNMVPQASNACDVNNLISLQLFEEQTGQLHCLLLSPEDHQHASTNAVFAEQVLRQHKETYLIRPVEDELEMPPMLECEVPSIQEEEEESTSNGSKGKSIRCSGKSEQVLLLVTLYEKFRELYDSGKLTNRQFFKKIVEGMVEKGYTYNVNQCSDKMESLKKMYKQIYDHNAKSGNDRKTFEFYERLDELFGNKPWIRPLSLAGSNIPVNLEEKENRGRSSNKQQKVTLQEAKLDYLKDAVKDRKLRREASTEYRARKLETLEKFVDVLELSVRNNNNNYDK